MADKFPIVIVISGNGSNLQAIIDAIENKMWDIEIKAVISNKAEAYGLQRAQQANIPTAVLQAKDYENREDYDFYLQKLIDSYHPKLVVLAGFLWILSAEFVRHFCGRLINVHPSLLPKHKGLHTHQQVLDADDETHGCTVHFVSEEVDAGAIIAQMECQVTADDTPETLKDKVHVLEYQLLPETIFMIAEGRVAIKKESF